MLDPYLACSAAKHALVLPFFAMPVVTLGRYVTGTAQGPTDSITVDLNLPGWSLSTTIQVIAIIAGVAAVLLQLHLQHRSELRLQKENHKEQLGLQLYRESTCAATETSSRVRDALTYVLGLAANMEIFHDAMTRGTHARPIRQRTDEFMLTHDRAETAVHELVNLIGAYQVTLARLDIFSLAFQAAAYDLQEAFGTLHSLLLDLLPIDIRAADGTVQIVNVQNPTKEQMQTLEQLTHAYTIAAVTLYSYLTDFKVELQNKLVGKLFGATVAGRVPPDPKTKVIATDAEHYDEMRKYFLEETAWGRSWQETRRRISESTRTETGTASNTRSEETG